LTGSLVALRAKDFYGVIEDVTSCCFVHALVRGPRHIMHRASSVVICTVDVGVLFRKILLALNKVAGGSLLALQPRSSTNKVGHL
jgi:hypothetical protein